MLTPPTPIRTAELLDLGDESGGYHGFNGIGAAEDLWTDLIGASRSGSRSHTRSQLGPEPPGPRRGLSARPPSMAETSRSSCGGSNEGSISPTVEKIARGPMKEEEGEGSHHLRPLGGASLFQAIARQSNRW